MDTQKGMHLDWGIINLVSTKKNIKYNIKYTI